MSKSTKITSINRNVRAKARTDEKDPSKSQKTSKTPSISKSTTATEKSKTKEDEKKTIKPGKPSVVFDLKQKNVLRNGSQIKPTVQNPRIEAKKQPLRAKHTPEIIRNVKDTKSRIANKANVMNTIHNVTVTSPPSKRKESEPQSLSKIDKLKEERSIRERTRTRTLEPDEVVVLKNAGPKSLDTFLANKTKVVSSIQDIPKQEPSGSNIKDPVAFEIKFEEKAKQQDRQQNSEKTKSQPQKDSEGSEEDPYEDDFESYESDFETGSSLAESSGTTSSTNEDTEGKQSSTNSEADSSDESEETQPPITVIHRDKEDERKLDSGNYDLNSRRDKLQQSQSQHFDSIDTSTINSEQLDSGISYSGNTSQSGRSSAGLSNFTKPTKMSKRGQELMQKIQLDTIEFILFELKPIAYEYYMKIYGHYNTTQSMTQTNEDRMDADCQTDEPLCRSIWTQHPPQYDLKFVQENNYVNLRNACGEFLDEENSAEWNENSGDPLTQSIRDLSKFRKNEMSRVLEIRKQVNFDRLNDFLNRSVPAVISVFSRTSKPSRLKSARLSISSGFYNLNTNFLNALRVVRIFSNAKYNLVLAVHEAIDEVYKSDFLNLISVWSTNESEHPIRLLSTWSEVCRIDICAESSDIIVCGLRDGSIAMWDLRETYSFCSKLDGYLKHFAATQSIAPTLGGGDMTLTDLGAVVDIKSFKPEAKIFNFNTYRPLQFVSLNDTGILTIWTLIETGNNSFTISSTVSDAKNSKIEYNSPWARVKLTQSAICDLREYLELKHIRMQNKFEKTRSYFENDIFNDEVLKELQGTQQDSKLGLQGLRFINLDTGVERIFVATNRNFIISCSKTLKLNRFGKLFIDETQFLFPTTIKLFPTEDFLIVGLSNGSVIALNCDQTKPEQVLEKTVEYEPKPGSSSNNSEFDLEIGKSCAIQNIIRNERKSYENFEPKVMLDSRTNSVIDANLEAEIGELGLRIFDQQVLLSGSVLRKGLIQNIEISYDGRKLYALTDGSIRSYDILLGKELSNSTSNSVVLGFGLVKETSGQQNLVLFTKETEVQIHNLK